MSQPGWFPDPGGQPGMFRYWDGRAWSDDVTPDPGAAAASQGYGSPLSGRTATDAFHTGSYAPHGPQGAAAFRATPQPQDKAGPPTGAIVAVVATLVIVGLVLFVFLRGGGGGLLGGQNQPQASATEDVCPKSKVQTTPTPHPNDGRVHGGALSYPMQGAPWTEPMDDPRVPFGADVKEQSFPVETNYDKRGNSWVASILVGDLVAGDGFYGAHEGAEIVAKCVVGLFYGDNKVDRTDVKSEAHPLDGRDGWLIQMHLSFDIKGLKCKGETATIVVITTGPDASSLYYSSIPDTTPQLMAVQDAALADLQLHA